MIIKSIILFFFDSGFRAKVFLSLVHLHSVFFFFFKWTWFQGQCVFLLLAIVSWLGWVFPAGSGSRTRVDFFGWHFYPLGLEWFHPPISCLSLAVLFII